MAVTTRFASASSLAAGTPTEAAITLPSTAAGDRLYIVLSYLSTSLTPTTPAGWTAVSGPTNYATFGAALFTRTADGSESGATVRSALVRPDTNSGTRWAATAVAVTGAGAPTIAAREDTVVSAQDTSMDLPQVTPAFADAYLVDLAAAYHAGAGLDAAFASPAGWTETADGVTTNTNGGRVGTWAATRQLAGGSGTATSPAVATTGTSTSSAQWLLAFPTAAATVAALVVDAGLDQTGVEPFAPVTVTAAPSGGTTPVGVAWSQTSGPTVTLTGTGPTRTFTAPPTVDGTEVVLTVTATDAAGKTATDNTTVGVLPHNEWVRGPGGAWVPLRFLPPPSASTTPPVLTADNA